MTLSNPGSTVIFMLNGGEFRRNSCKLSKSQVSLSSSLSLCLFQTFGRKRSVLHPQRSIHRSLQPQSAVSAHTHTHTHRVTLCGKFTGANHSHTHSQRHFEDFWVSLLWRVSAVWNNTRLFTACVSHKLFFCYFNMNFTSTLHLFKNERLFWVTEVLVHQRLDKKWHHDFL